MALLLLLAALVLELPALVPVAVVLLGGLYGVQLAIDDASLDSGAPLFAAGALGCAELAFWSLEERDRVKSELGEGFRRIALCSLLALGAVVVAAALLALVDRARAGGLGLDLLGAAAAAAVIVAIVLAARARET